MTSLTDIAVANRSVTRELSIGRTRPRRRQYLPLAQYREFNVRMMSGTASRLWELEMSTVERSLRADLGTPRYEVVDFLRAIAGAGRKRTNPA
jgi:hypothetical protein